MKVKGMIESDVDTFKVGDVIEVKFTRTGKVKKLMKGFAPIVKVEG